MAIKTAQQILNDVLTDEGLAGVVDTVQQALNLVHDPVNHALKCNIIGGGGGGVTDHEALTGIETAGAGIDHGHITDQAQTIAGIKTVIEKLLVKNGAIDIGKVDAFGRTLIFNQGINACIKIGGIQQDGDPANVSGEGAIFVGANSTGAFDYNNWAFARIKSTRFGINNCIANVQAYIFRADESGMYLKNDSGAKTFDVVRSTGKTFIPIIAPLSDSATALRFTKADGTTVIITIDTTAAPKVTINGEARLAASSQMGTAGESLATKKYVDDKAGSKFYSGSGNPNGVQSGLAGDTYLDTVLNIFYKCSINGNNNWIVI